MTISTAVSSDAASAREMLASLLVPDPPPFALLRRAKADGDQVELLTGEVTELSALAELSLPGPADADPSGHDVLAVIPYRQVVERGYDCHDDGEPILSMAVTGHGCLTTVQALTLLPDDEVAVHDGDFDVGDEEYARIVEKIIDGEIRAGEGSNFVIRRSFRASVAHYRTSVALSIFRRLLARETNAYWTFLVHTGGRTFVGASPEQHVHIADGTALMNPISGTYRYPRSGADLGGVLDFLADQKEIDELYMVVDEELKMMARVCDSGARVRGPYLREMARLAHTEYVLEGRSSLDLRDVLRETMFAPTVIGSPLRNACRVVARHELGGRGFYGGAVALLGRDGAGRSAMDSAILIRTADIDPAGSLRIDVGATLVRHSRAAAEVAETWSKVDTLLAATGVDRDREAARPRADAVGPALSANAQVVAALKRRNAGLSSFWLDGAGTTAPVAPPSVRRLLIVDAEDMFTEMLGHQARSLGLDVTIRACASVSPADMTDFDCVLLGPGPGDPMDGTDARIVRLRELAGHLLDHRIPFVAECLSHQVLASTLGFGVYRREQPNQGTQRHIDLFGTREPVGFYNSYVARHDRDLAHHRLADGAVEVCRDDRTGEVHALRGGRFASTQFHLESVLTRRGTEMLARLIGWATTESFALCGREID